MSSTVFVVTTGYAFLLFRDEISVHRLVKSCLSEEGKLYMYVSSLTQSNKKVRPLTTTSTIQYDGYLPPTVQYSMRVLATCAEMRFLVYMYMYI